MNEITLLGNQILYYDREEKKKAPLFSAVQFLWSTVKIHQSATVRTLMEILSSDSEFFQKALMEPYLVELINYYRDPLFSPKKSDLKSIKFCWWGESWKYKKAESSFYLGFDVYGANEEHENWGIEFLPIESLIDLPIIVDKKVSVSCYDTTKSEEERRKRKEPYDEKYDFGIQDFCLIELLKAFVSEVTFCGSEEEKVDRFEDLMERTRQIKKDLENGDTRKFSSFEELKDKLKDKLKLDSKENDDLDEDSFRKMMGEDDD